MWLLGLGFWLGRTGRCLRRGKAAGGCDEQNEKASTPHPFGYERHEFFPLMPQVLRESKLPMFPFVLRLIRPSVKGFRHESRILVAVSMAAATLSGTVCAQQGTSAVHSAVGRNDSARAAAPQ